MEGEFNFLYVFAVAFISLIALGIYGRRKPFAKVYLYLMALVPLALGALFLNISAQSDFRIIPWEFGAAAGLGISSIINLLILITVGIEKSTLKSLDRYYQYLAAQNGLKVNGFDLNKSLAEYNRTAVTLEGTINGKMRVTVWFTYSTPKMHARDMVHEKMKKFGGFNASFMTIYLYSPLQSETFSLYCPKDNQTENYPNRIPTGIKELDEKFVMHDLNAAAAVKMKQPDVARFLLDNTKLLSQHLSLDESGKFTFTMHAGSTKESDAEHLKKGISLVHQFWEIYHTAGERRSDH